MDYGQHGQIPTNQGLFTDGLTAGVGITDERNNPLEDQYNIDSSKFQNPIVDAHPTYSDLGRTALANQEPSIEQTPSSAPNFYEFPPSYMPESAPNLGQITTIETPPLVDQSNTSQNSPEGKKHFVGGEKISKSDIEYIQSAEEELAQDGDIAKFYDFWAAARSDAIGDVANGSNVKEKAA